MNRFSQVTDGGEGEKGRVGGSGVKKGRGREGSEDGDKGERRNKQAEAKNKSGAALALVPRAVTHWKHEQKNNQKLIIALFVSATQILVTHPARSPTVRAETEFYFFFSCRTAQIRERTLSPETGGRKNNYKRKGKKSSRSSNPKKKKKKNKSSCQHPVEQTR